jgi:hypothetical protein
MGGRPLIWLGLFRLIAGLLVIKSAFCLLRRLSETADEADNSIPAMQAQQRRD